MRLPVNSTLSGCLLCAIAVSQCCTNPVLGQASKDDDPDLRSAIQMLESGTTEEKRDAAASLAEFGPYARRAVPALSKALASDDPALQYEALVALSHIGPLAADAVDSVAELLSSDVLPLRVAALDTLRQIGNASAGVVEKIEDLAAHTDEVVTTAAVRCLITLDQKESAAVTAAVPRLITALSSDRASVRNSAETALVEVGDSVAQSLKPLLSSDRAIVRLKACEVIEGLGTGATALVPKLIDLLHDKDELVVRAAATALGSIRGDAPRVVPELEKLLSGQSPAVTATTLAALGRFGSQAQSAVPAVCALSDGDSPIVRSAAASALGQIGADNRQAVQALVELIKDPHGGVTIQAAGSLSQMGAVAVPALMTLLKEPEYRELAVNVLGELGADAKSAVPALVRLVSTEDENLRRQAFIALATIGPDAKSAVPALMKMLKDPGAGRRRGGAAYVLANIGEEKSIPVLKSILTESSEVEPLIGRAAAWALIMLQPHDPENVQIVMPFLIEALDADDPFVRQEALTALSKLGAAARSGGEVLAEMAAHDPDPAVRAEAIHTMGVLEAFPDSALPLAITALDDDDPAIRSAAAFLLGRIGAPAKATAAKLSEATRVGAELDRMIAAWALVRVSPTEENGRLATPFMLTALRFPAPEVRTEGAQTLGMIGISSPEIVAALETAATDPESEVAAAAKKALQQLH